MVEARDGRRGRRGRMGMEALCIALDLGLYHLSILFSYRVPHCTEVLRLMGEMRGVARSRVRAAGELARNQPSELHLVYIVQFSCWVTYVISTAVIRLRRRVVRVTVRVLLGRRRPM